MPAGGQENLAATGLCEKQPAPHWSGPGKLAHNPENGADGQKPRPGKDFGTKETTG